MKGAEHRFWQAEETQLAARQPDTGRLSLLSKDEANTVSLSKVLEYEVLFEVRPIGQ